MGMCFCRKKKKQEEEQKNNTSQEIKNLNSSSINPSSTDNINSINPTTQFNSISQNQESIEYYKNLLTQKEKEKQKMKEVYEQKIKTIILNEPEPILVGLDNIDASGYMNATFQCLSNTKSLTEFFLKRYKYNKEDNNKIISNEYYKIISNLWNIENNKKYYSLKSFKEVLTQYNLFFNVNEPKELLTFLLERIHQELKEEKIVKLRFNTPQHQLDENKMKKREEKSVKLRFNTLQDQFDEKKMLYNFLIEFKNKYNTIISNIFYGVMKTKKKCQSCNNIIYNFNVFSFLEFPLNKVNKYCFDKGINTNDGINIYECFNYYENMENMTGENQIYCDICQHNCDALYRISLYSVPNYLIIILNRGKEIINEYNVIFPIKLNIFNYVFYKDGNTYYELYAIICLIMHSPMNGNFVAYCKNKINKKWYKYNNSIIKQCVKQDEYKDGIPYILFYQAL